jgi:hypothetical protein
MNNKIANIIVDYIKDLTWIDKLAGLTQVAKINQNGVEKRYPISCSMAFDDTCVEGCYDELAPNSAYQSVVYFEDDGFTFDHQAGNKLYYNSSLRLIAWLNYNKLGGGCGSTGNYIIDIIRALPSYPVNVSDLLGVNIRVMSQAIRSDDIFSKYTFNEKQTQYLMLPFDFFSLEIKTSFYIIPECVEDTSGCLEC